MDHQHHSDRQSDTTTVVVVAVIVGVLLVTLALALVALGGFLYFRIAAVPAREEAARARAENNLKQVEMALRQYEAATETTEPTDEPLRILAWNIESGGNDPEVIADQLGQLDRCDIYALSEVHAANTRRYLLAAREAHGTLYDSFVSVTGGGDRC